jgi:hypothetical protein
MSSQRKLDANRRNAQRSTGPRTPEGKAKVATNSCTHELCSRNAVLPEEDPADFQTLLDGLRDLFQPANAFEDSSVRELACAEWRLRRALRIETGILVYGMERARQTERCPNTAPSSPLPRGDPLRPGNPPSRHLLLSKLRNRRPH